MLAMQVCCDQQVSSEKPIAREMRSHPDGEELLTPHCGSWLRSCATTPAAKTAAATKRPFMLILTTRFDLTFGMDDD